MRIRLLWLGTLAILGGCVAADGGPPPEYPGWYDGPYYPWYGPDTEIYGGGVVVEGGWGHPGHHAWHGGWHGNWQGRAHGNWGGGRPGGWHGGSRGGSHSAPTEHRR